MLLYQILIAFIPLIQSVSSTLKDVKFTKLWYAENFVYNDHLLFDYSARSKLHCLELCVESSLCVRFTHTGKRGTPGRCRGHSTQLSSSEEGADALGAMTYVWTGLRGELVNVALNKTATQSSEQFGGTADKAVDGNPNVKISAGSCTHTNSEANVSSWWQVDLGTDVIAYDIISVIITSRVCNNCANRLRDYDIDVYADDPAANQSVTGTLCSHYDGPMEMGTTEERVCTNGPISGRFVRVTNAPGEVLSLCEVQVMAEPPV